MNTEKLISLKENFTGQKFQWIKPDKPELLAKVVRCKDVDPLSDGRFFIIFDDGSRVDSSKLNSNLLMIHGDMQPLSRQEVESIYGVKPKTVPQPAAPPKPASVAPAPAPAVTAPPAPEAVAAPVAPKTNMFAMFNAEESPLTLTLSVKIPDKKLLKLMYSSAENKDKFITELAEHLHSMINKQVVKESIQSILIPPAPKKERGIINLTEVDASK